MEHVIHRPLSEGGVLDYQVERGQQLLVPDQRLGAGALRGHQVKECGLERQRIDSVPIET